LFFPAAAQRSSATAIACACFAVAGTPGAIRAGTLRQ
jgi:hypothetical protein